ncbi:MAG: Na/Pi cotransporter family protein [Candidatus Thorarchaeota archaeon]|nr:Na/Pi cotransporter family protein [Candidatus Thorarchaeota archaeon]
MVSILENLVIVVGGLALFMYAITLLRETLGKLSGARVARILERVSNDPVKGMGAGAGATIMTQSSSITVLTLIGFVNAGMMTFRQSVNVMLGAEIGTTITAQLVSFDIGFFYWPLLVIGFFGMMLAPNDKWKNIFKVMFSLGMIFLSMGFMKDGAKAIIADPDNTFFVDAITEYSAFPIIGILIGTAIAGATQSSSATTSLVIALGAAGLIGLPMGIALAMGANIGTCFLELAAGIGATTPAKRTAIAQTMINVIGVAIFFPFIGPFSDLIAATSVTGNPAIDVPRQIANAHTIFNVAVSLLFIPFVGLLVKFCERIIPDKEGEIIGRHFFDDQMLHLPQAALLEAENEMHKIAETTIEMIRLGETALLEKNMDDARRIMNLEEDVDERCRATEVFIDKIREEELSERDIIWRMKLIAMLTDIERVGDLCENIGEFALEHMKNGVAFSNSGLRDLRRMFSLVEETYMRAVEALKTRNRDLAKDAEQLEDEVDLLERELKTAHTKRMSEGVCMAEADTVFIETLRNLERISDHADNIALDILMDR